MDFFEDRDEWARSPKVDPLKSEIAGAFDDATVLITGATGFIGKLVMEALLRKVKKVKKIYILVREKRGKTPKERLEDEFNDLVYPRLKKVCGSRVSKVALMLGDITQPNCGLSAEDVEKLKREVNFIFHIAASLRFEEHLTAAFNCNVRATRFLIETAAQATNFKAFVHVSTAYSHACKPDISEKFYDMPYSVPDVEQITDQLNYHEVASISPLIIGPWTNSYAFTKALSEEIVKNHVGKLPICVVRPSIVIGCYEEPMVGWINNVYGATGVAAAAGVGLMHTWYGGSDKKADMIPADMVAHTILAAAYETYTTFKNKAPLEIPVYNAVSSPKNQVTWGDYMEQLQRVKATDDLASCKSIGPYFFNIDNSMFVYKLKMYFLQLLPALLVDLVLRLKGKPPMLFKGYIKIHTFNMRLRFYAEREWNYDQCNVENLWERLSTTDQALFPFILSKFRWDIHLGNSMRAIRIYIVKDDISTLEKSRVFRDRLDLGLSVIKNVFFLSVAYLTLKMYSWISTGIYAT